jgi:predicted transcriptional regulator
MNNSVSFKAQSATERSGDILLSFSAGWLDALRSKIPKYIFRRRVPALFVPRRVFVYIAAPNSEIIGFFTIKEIQHITLADALNRSVGAMMNVDEIKRYFCGYGSIGCFCTESNVLFKEPIRLSELREQFNFFPPQSFVALSGSSSDWIDKRGQPMP